MPLMHAGNPYHYLNGKPISSRRYWITLALAWAAIVLAFCGMVYLLTLPLHFPFLY